jgi:hypothetical protein
VHSPTGNFPPDIPCLLCQPVNPKLQPFGRIKPAMKKLGHVMDGDMDKPVLPHITTGKPQRADGTKDNTPPTSSCLSPSMRTRESLQGMRRTVEVGRGDSYRNVQGPAGSQIGHSSLSVGKPHTWRRPLGIGSVTANYSGNAQAVTPRTRWNPDEINVIVNCPLYREPCAVKVARTVLTGGLGKRTLGQRALILPTAFSTRHS